ncbi:MAG: sigma-70 family RNA polymerase sigma factor [Kofleriaceae bacterium]|nr:sigma-70 family RNA polymerase sigma factor [Kofleriaceae bacterium]
MPRPAISTAQTRLLEELAELPARKGFAIANDLLRNRAEAEEAVQEALARACESLGDLRDPNAATAWFLRIVTTMCLRTLRRRRLQRALFGKAPVLDAESSAAATGEANLPSSTRDVPVDESMLAARMHAVDALPLTDTALTSAQDTQALLAGVHELPSKQKIAVVLRYGHDLAVPQIAELLGVSQATAKTHLVRGLERLRSTMENHR